MSCDSQPSLFDDLEEPAKRKGRRNPPREPAQRQRGANLHLPIYDEQTAELRRLEDLATTQRPIARADCEEEARPCPWVKCPKHLYFDRFEEFAEIIEGIANVEADDDEAIMAAVVVALISRFEPTDDDLEGRAKRPRTVEALREAVANGRALVTSFKRGTLRSDVLSSPHVSGPWPTCSLDVAMEIREAGAELEQEDTARILGKTREGVRQIELRMLPILAADPALRPWVDEIVGEERLDELARTAVDWDGDGY